MSMSEKELFAMYGIELERIRNEFVTNISNKGVEVSSEATLQQLAPLVNDITGGFNPYILTSDKVKSNAGVSYIEQLSSYQDSNAIIVGRYAFKNAYNLYSVDLPNVIQLNAEAFEDWNNSNTWSFVNINLPNLEVIQHHAFSSASMITNWLSKNYVTEFSKVHTLESGAFGYLYSNSFSYALSFPAITELPNDTFVNCSRLGASVSLIFPNLSYVPSHCFREAQSGDDYLGLAVYLPNVRTIGVGAFEGMSGSNKRIYLGGQITNINASAFMSFGCGIIHESLYPYLSLPRVISTFTNVTHIGSAAFYSYHGINAAGIDFPKAKYIYPNAFTFADFEYIDFVGANPYIYSYAFSNCSSPIINLKASSVGSGAFSNAYGLATIEVSSATGISGTLASYAFANAPNLSCISGAIKSIPNGAFWNASALTALYLYDVDGKITPLNVTAYSAFNGTPIYGSGSGHIYVPSSLYNQYMSATNWIGISGKIIAM